MHHILVCTVDIYVVMNLSLYNALYLLQKLPTGGKRKPGFFLLETGCAMIGA